MTPRQTLDYCTYDVFTDQAFGGNPLAIVFEADNLNAAQMQVIAREFNFSETVFFQTPKEASHTMRLRIFTPTRELPFAGHPTIGAAVALSDLGHGPDLILELGVGALPAKAEQGAASFHAAQPVETLARPDAELVAKTLGLLQTDIAKPPVMASMGVPFTFTALTSRAALSNIEIDLTEMRTGNARYPSGRDFSQAAYWRDDSASNEAGHDVIHLRMFAPLDSIPEDPATGSAAATLAGLLCADRGAPVSLTVYQGQDMGRPSVIKAQASDNGVTISGPAIKMMQGQILV
ncbi:MULTISPECIES: PhzF family phenazine biosynthesis protein [Pacificibacter]|uniref:PhzF family phenazine biosynthesis protein n=1 Tax=Pacificibacter TaxID=1042323 RepID=UPI001C092CBD|nr:MULTISPECIES: PhzF family phenazine biosynthesis protein [Pacificibacter]MBU2935610.1 PhzF family phenazine biosynthesis protein [Pacificibacter marinus]MDO6614106.1 PhzF family phenazine biosynthesis protein [Pacificibacter sp. 1_MG-2023]